MRKTEILVVEDEYLTSTDIKNCLIDLGYDVTGVVDNGASAIQIAGELKPDLVLMDITLKGKMTGIEAAEKIQTRFGLPVVYLTGHSDDRTIREAGVTEPFGYLVKPLEERVLNSTIQMALFKHETDRKLIRSECTNRALLNAIPDALMLIDGEKCIVAINETMARILGSSPSLLKNTFLGDLNPGRLPGFSLQDIDHVYEDGDPVKRSAELEGRWFETSMYPASDSTSILGLIAVQSHDITDWKLLEEELKREGVSQVERTRDQCKLVNNRIRTSLQEITGYLRMIDNEYSEQIDLQVGIIDDLIERLDKGCLESEKVRSLLFNHYLNNMHIPREKEPAGGCR